MSHVQRDARSACRSPACLTRSALRVPQVSAHGNSWKQLFFERHVQEVLEGWDPAQGDLLQLRRLLAFSRRFVQALHVRQLPSHLDLQLLFECMVK